MRKRRNIREWTTHLIAETDPDQVIEFLRHVKKHESLPPIARRIEAIHQHILTALKSIMRDWHDGHRFDLYMQTDLPSAVDEDRKRMIERQAKAHADLLSQENPCFPPCINGDRHQDDDPQLAEWGEFMQFAHTELRRFVELDDIPTRYSAQEVIDMWLNYDESLVGITSQALQKMMHARVTALVLQKDLLPSERFLALPGVRDIMEQPMAIDRPRKK